MIRVGFFRYIQDIKQALIAHIRCYKKWYIIFGIVAIFSILLGLIVGFKKASASDFDSAKIVSQYVTDTNVFANLLQKVFLAICFLLATLILCVHPVLSIGSIVMLIGYAYTVGLNFAYLIKVFHIGGILNVVLFNIPFELIIIFCLISWMAVCFDYNAKCRIFGGNVLSKEFICTKYQSFLYALLVVVGVAFLQVILRPLCVSILILGN